MAILFGHGSVESWVRCFSRKKAVKKCRISTLPLMGWADMHNCSCKGLEAKRYVPHTYNIIRTSMGRHSCMYGVCMYLCTLRPCSVQSLTVSMLTSPPGQLAFLAGRSLHISNALRWTSKPDTVRKEKFAILRLKSASNEPQSI